MPGRPRSFGGRIKPAPEQLAIADQLGIQVSPDDTFAAVASAILERVADAIGCPPRVVSDRQRELADELEIDLTDCSSLLERFCENPGGDSDREPGRSEANGAETRRNSLHARRPHGTASEGKRWGERWESVAGQFPREYEVSSIREDGQGLLQGG